VWILSKKGDGEAMCVSTNGLGISTYRPSKKARGELWHYYELTLSIKDFPKQCIMVDGECSVVWFDADAGAIGIPLDDLGELYEFLKEKRDE
jgi:hypothetical protein